MAKKRQEVKEEQDLISQMKVGRIPKEYLTKLLLDYRFEKAVDKNTPMPRLLAQVILIIVEKMIGSSNWRNYSQDWKEDFRGKAYEHILKYAHNFDQAKCSAGKGADPYNYIAQIVYRAFVQSWRKCKQHAERNAPMNPNLVYMSNHWDEDQLVTPDNEMMTPDITSMDWTDSGMANGY
jgi:hypothetical protein